MTADDDSLATVPLAERIVDQAPRHSPLWKLLSRWLLSFEAWLRSRGGTPLRNGIRLFWAVIGIVGVVLLIGPVINPPLTLDDILSSSDTATDRWIARDFSAEYTVDVADDGALVTVVEERITAFFPDDVDESGIQRVIPTEFQGHALEPSAISATIDGESVDVKQASDPTTLTLSVDAGQRLQGDHVVVVRYTLHDLAFETGDRITGDPVHLLEWDVFGPAWPQGLAGLEVTVRIADKLDEALVRQPRGIVVWTLLSAGEWLEPEPSSPPGFTTYQFSNDQNLPPHASAIFTFVFEPGPITMPAPSAWFWVATFGPLLPLAFLLVTLLFSIAARLVAWSDARGRPWYVAQSEPPDDTTARLAAHILRAPRALELGDALQAIPEKDATARDRILAAGRAAKRTGRLGDIPRALRLYALGSERREQLTRGLRRIPEGFVRDAFIAAPIALTIVQWGVIRQLSYQAKLAIVWWPLAFVVASTVVALVVLTLALSARPLTEKGAILKQHLLGIDAFAEQTSLLERSSLRDPALPYAVLTSPPREAGAAVAELVEAELEERIPRRSWVTSDFLTPARLGVRVLALLVVLGSIAIVVFTPNPYQRTHRYLAYSDDVPGSSWTQVEGFAAEAELTRDDENRAVIQASETLTVRFEEGSSLPPQLVRQWRTTVDGQALDVTIESVEMDGSPVPYRTETDYDSIAMRTTLSEVVIGEHEVRIEYRIGSAAFAAESADGILVDRVRWAALLQGWKYDYGNDEDVLEPLSLEFRVDEELAAEAEDAGWITLETSPDVRAGEWPDAVVPFGAVSGETGAEAAVETTSRSDGVAVHSLEIGEAEFGGYPWTLTIRDLGTMLDFPAGTFAGPDESALRATRFAETWPLVTAVVMGWLGAGLALLGFVLVLRRKMAPVGPGLTRDVLRWLVPALAIGASILFVWVSMEVAADHPAVGPSGWAALVALVGAGISLWLGWRRGKETT